MQKEIAFILKLCRLRRWLEKAGKNKINVLNEVSMLETLIAANKYETSNDAKTFFVRHRDKIELILTKSNIGLVREYNELFNKLIHI
jgi:hypothetical protein